MGARTNKSCVWQLLRCFQQHVAISDRDGSAANSPSMIDTGSANWMPRKRGTVQYVGKTNTLAPWRGRAYIMGVTFQFGVIL